MGVQICTSPWVYKFVHLHGCTNLYISMDVQFCTPSIIINNGFGCTIIIVSSFVAIYYRSTLDQEGKSNQILQLTYRRYRRTT